MPDERSMQDAHAGFRNHILLKVLVVHAPILIVNYRAGSKGVVHYIAHIGPDQFAFQLHSFDSTFPLQKDEIHTYYKL